MIAGRRRSGIRRGLVALLLAVPAVLAAAMAEPDGARQREEVSFLLGYVDGSACDFYRNGKWHTAREAQVHLREKYRWLAARERVVTAEDFIENAGSRSSLTGEAYAVRCGDGVRVAAAAWLRAELERLRAL